MNQQNLFDLPTDVPVEAKRVSRARTRRRKKLDIGGQKGNAFWVLGYAKTFAEQLGYEPDEILAEMKEADYDHLLAVFNKYFGDLVLLVSDHSIPGVNPIRYEIEDEDECVYL